MSIAGVGIEEHLRNSVRKARQAYQEARGAGDWNKVWHTSKELDAAEDALRKYLDRRDEESAPKTKRPSKPRKTA